MATIKERNVAILAVDGFEQVEMTGPRDSLQAAGARTVLISAKTDPILGMHHDKPGNRFPVDMTFYKPRRNRRCSTRYCCRAAW
ncbi:DJ-1/PfpI family protein [Achromobacter denitrificans]